MMVDACQPLQVKDVNANLVGLVFFAINENILVDFISIRDSGGSILVHEFGAYFGLAVSLVIQNEGEGHELEASNYHSDLFAMVGEYSRLFR